MELWLLTELCAGSDYPSTNCVETIRGRNTHLKGQGCSSWHSGQVARALNTRSTFLISIILDFNISIKRLPEDGRLPNSAFRKG